MSFGARSWIVHVGAQVWLGVLFLLTVGCALPELACSQPANDGFGQRQNLTGLPATIEGSNIGATIEPGELSEVTEAGAGTVWWEWTAPAAGRITISTAGSAIDTLLAVYTGLSLTNLTLVTSNDDEDVLAGLFTSRVTFLARAGTSYSIVVAGLKQENGKFDAGSIHLSIAPAPTRPAPAWAGTDITGKAIQSSDFAGQIVLLDFWATWCAPCRAEIPIFIDLQNRFGKEGFVVIGISVDTVGPAAVRQFMTELGMNYPVLLTSSKLEQDLGGIPSIPTAFIIDRENNLIERHVGFGDREFWEKAIIPLLDSSTAAPSLSIQSASGKVTLAWPGGVPGFVLESAEDLGFLSWTPRREPVEISNGQNAMTLPASSQGEFFRLRKP